MMTASKALNARQLKHYHDREFSAVKENYYTHGHDIGERKRMAIQRDRFCHGNKS